MLNFQKKHYGLAMKITYLEGKNINLRDVEISDAEFILELRTNEKKSKFLYKTENDVRKQVDYIEKYKCKDDEYYFIIESKNNVRLGTMRLYDIRREIDSFSIGSWLLIDNIDITVALECSILLYDFGFITLGFENCHFDVRKENTRVNRYHRQWGGIEIISEDSLNYYYSYGKNNYLKFKRKIQLF